MSIYIIVSVGEDRLNKILLGATEAIEALCDRRQMKNSELFSKLKPLFDLVEKGQ